MKKVWKVVMRTSLRERIPCFEEVRVEKLTFEDGKCPLFILGKKEEKNVHYFSAKQLASFEK